MVAGGFNAAERRTYLRLTLTSDLEDDSEPEDVTKTGASSTAEVQKQVCFVPVEQGDELIGESESKDADDVGCACQQLL